MPPLSFQRYLQESRARASNDSLRINMSDVIALNAEIDERIVNGERLYTGNILRLEKWNVVLPNGESAVREVVVHNGASAVVPIDKDGYVYLVRQYRAALKRELLEIPAGKLDYPGEDRLSAAKRELREETGFSAAEWTHLSDIATTPGFSTEIISLYMARGLESGENDLDDDEFLLVARMPFAEAVKMAASGEISDAKTVAALFLAQSRLKAEEA